MTDSVLWDAAWPDEVLGAACVDLRAGMVGAARDVLAKTRRARDWERRALASGVLAAVAAGSNVAEVWQREEPGCPDAWLLCARAVVVRALALFHRDGPTPEAVGQVTAAMDACRLAFAQGGYDPVVWVAVLALWRTGVWPSVEPATPALAPVRCQRS